jgi:serine/threonine protein kinase
MGEVYRARDARLGRDAAIKILPDAFVNDADRVARFEREARTLASLNHPNIAQIYGLEEGPAAGSAGVAISHDGRRIAYGHGEVGGTIVVKALDQFADTSLTVHRRPPTHRRHHLPARRSSAGPSHGWNAPAP